MNHVIAIKPFSAYRSGYLNGTTPQWEDIQQNLDAPREITDELEVQVAKALTSQKAAELFAILGSAGCGKSTILRRLGMRLAQAGWSVYLTNSEELPRPATIARALDEIPQRSVLLFDNAEVALGFIPSLASALSGVDRPPILVLASRTNDFDRRSGRIQRSILVSEYSVPHLTRREIEAVIGVLDKSNMLGHLRGLSGAKRISEFEMRANKQILVAMREATSGRGFDEIIADEFTALTPDESRLLCLCIALATEAGYRISRQQFIGCAYVEPATALHLLERNLRDVVVPSGPANELLLLRHRKIAEHVVEAVATREQLAESYVRLLRALTTDIGGQNWRTRSFALYRSIINHQTIYRRFSNDIERARSVYDSLASSLANDYQFWLQYGSLELEAENLELAENYLNQALSLAPTDLFVNNAKGHLLLRKAVSAGTKAQATLLAAEGRAILEKNIQEAGSEDPYCYHISLVQIRLWIARWCNKDEARKELETLRALARGAKEKHPRDPRIRVASELVERDYLALAVASANS